jgi:hypothetical protein
MVKEAEEIRIWKEAFLVYLKESSQHSSGNTK